MSKDLKKQTGPKTMAGKQVASKNAQKGAIFSKGYLPSENIEQKQLEFEGLCEQWHAYDPSRLMILRTIEQANLGLERMMAAEKLKIEGAMLSLDIAQAFSAKAGLNVMSAPTLPAWFFMTDDGGQKNRAIYLDMVWDQANSLKAKFSDQIVPQIAALYPELYHYVMQGQQPNASFVMVLGQRYKQSAVTLNLAQLMNSINEKYPHHLTWAADPQRYQILIDGIRAAQMYEVMDLEKSNRYATSFQNRFFKGFQMLAVLDQHESKISPVIENNPALVALTFDAKEGS